MLNELTSRLGSGDQRSGSAGVEAIELVGAVLRLIEAGASSAAMRSRSWFETRSSTMTAPSPRIASTTAWTEVAARKVGEGHGLSFGRARSPAIGTQGFSDEPNLVK